MMRRAALVAAILIGFIPVVILSAVAGAVSVSIGMLRTLADVMRGH